MTILNNPYKFTGKELDENTGLYYYGARYYDPKLSIWLSVDPLAEEYPDASPYVYCNDNPINLVDPTGMYPDPPSKGWNRFWGGVKLVGGLVEASVGTVGGVATSWTGVGGVVGAVVAVHGADVAGSGLKQLWTGNDESSLTSKAIQSTGVSKENADAIDSGISVVGAGTATGIAMKAKDASTVRVVSGASKELTKQELKSISSYKKLITEHKAKLGAYIKNPAKYDNQGLLAKAPNQEVKQKIINARIKHLKHEIETFQKNIKKIQE